MDPNATLLDALDALACEDVETARDALATLLDWLTAGGFAPTVCRRAVRATRRHSYEIG